MSGDELPEGRLRGTTPATSEPTIGVETRGTIGSDARDGTGGEIRDDLGDVVPLAGRARRVVSLVPSLTEAIAATAPGVLVGVTDFCTHPADLAAERVRGTKNPDVTRIVALKPDLVVANQEENRALDVARLRDAGVPVWVTRIDTVDEACASMGRLLEVAFGERPAWLDEARGAWAAAALAEQVPGDQGQGEPGRSERGRGEQGCGGPRVAVPIWRDPWLWVGSGTYADDVLRRLGLTNAVTGPRYPRLDPSALSDVDVLLLPDEPYAFTAADADAVPGARAVCVEGRDLFWYGPAMIAARERLAAALGG